MTTAQKRPYEDIADLKRHYPEVDLDPDFTDRVILLADRRDGHPLSSKEGPFRIVVPGEKRHARWVREVTALVIQEAR